MSGHRFEIRNSRYHESNALPLRKRLLVKSYRIVLYPTVCTRLTDFTASVWSHIILKRAVRHEVFIRYFLDQMDLTVV